MRINSDDPDENPVNVLLNGNGVLVMVTSPNGGETLITANKWTITWQTSNATHGLVAKSILKYTVDKGVTWRKIKALGDDPGTYSWTVPYVATDKYKCKVKVILRNAAGGTLASDKSDSCFTITNP
jgi:hypothetical protein